MDNQDLFEKVIQAFDDNDSKALIELVTDDFQWEMVGDQKIDGKEKLRHMFEASSDIKMIGSTKEFKLLAGEKAACSGVVQMESPDGKRTEEYYCDLYEFKDGKLQKMTTFTKTKK